MLGAWLHLWTPPRDVDVPPVPWRAVGVGRRGPGRAGASLLVACGHPGDARRTTGRPPSASRPPPRPGCASAAAAAGGRAGAAPGAGRRPATSAERRALVGLLESSVGDDARARVRAGALKGRIRRVDCASGGAQRGRRGGARGRPRARAGGLRLHRGDQRHPRPRGRGGRLPVQGRRRLPDRAAGVVQDQPAAGRAGGRRPEQACRACPASAAIPARARVRSMPYTAAGDRYELDALPPLRAQRHPAARDLVRAVEQLRRRQAARGRSGRCCAARSTAG